MLFSASSFFCLAERDPQMQIPDRIYSACRKRARAVGDGRIRNPCVQRPPIETDFRVLWTLTRFSLSRICLNWKLSRLLRTLNLTFRFSKLLDPLLIIIIINSSKERVIRNWILATRRSSFSFNYYYIYNMLIILHYFTTNSLDPCFPGFNSRRNSIRRISQ